MDADEEELDRLRRETADQGLAIDALREQAAARDRDIARLRRVASHSTEQVARLTARERTGRAERDRQEALIERLRRDAHLDAAAIADLRERLAGAEDELEDLRAVRAALTPPELPERPGLDLAAAYLPASDRVSGDFYMAAAGPRDSTVMVVGDVVGHGIEAARRAAFVRTTFVTTAPYSDDPSRLLEWANLALVERAGVSSTFVTVACVTWAPRDGVLRWAYAGHPPALRLDSGEPLEAIENCIPLGIDTRLGSHPTESEMTSGTGLVLYTDGLTEARGPRDREDLFGIVRVGDSVRSAASSAPRVVVDGLQAAASEFAGSELDDDLCILAARAT